MSSIVAIPGFESQLHGHLVASPEATLGTYTKSSPKITTPESLQAPKIQGLRADRYRLQTSARALYLAMYRSKNGNDPYIPLDDYNKLHRVVKCCRTAASFQVDIHSSLEHKKAFYGGVSICGSVWTCPVCSAKVAERRRDEISQGISWAYDSGYQVVMVTLTFPHRRFQTCDDLLKSQSDALKRFRQGGDWSRFKERLGFQGLIRSLEVTYGDNGWHPHTHELWIMDNGIDVSDFETFVRSKWEKSCAKAGLIPKGKLRSFRQHSVDFRYNVDSSDYLEKNDDESNLRWGADREMASGRSKVSKGAHPFQLLDAFSRGDLYRGNLFLEYSESFKGKRQIFWTPGLKKRAGLGDKTDEQLAEEQDDKAVLLASLSQRAWKVVLNNNARSTVLDIAENLGIEGLDSWFRDNGVDLFVDSFRDYKQRSDGEVASDSIYVPVDVIDFTQ